MFRTGQVLPELPAIVGAAHSAGARVLVDLYHSLGVFPVDVSALDADFAVGGSYKYLRGGPGACYLYVHPRHLDGRLRTLDIGWFAKAAPFLTSVPTPRATRRAAMRGSNRRPRCSRSTSRGRDSGSSSRSASRGCGTTRSRCSGGSSRSSPSAGSRRRAAGRPRRFRRRAPGGRPRACRCARGTGIATDARDEWLRLCPDVLTTDDELVRAANALAQTAGPRDSHSGR